MRVMKVISSKKRLAIVLLAASMLWEMTALMAGNLVINEVVSNNDSSLADYAGDSPDWIELFNGSDAEINLNGYKLTDDATDPAKWKFGMSIIEPGGFLVIFASGKVPPETVDEFHAGFRINSSGEILHLFDPSGKLVDRIALGPLAADEAIGRQPDGKANWYTAKTPTPSQPNVYAKKNLFLEMPEFSVSGGFYKTSQSIEIINGPKLGSIRYTLDGSVPSKRSKRYTGPILLTKTTILRARNFGLVTNQSRTRTETYFIKKTHSLPVVSISVDPKRMFNAATGMYAKGPSASSSFPYYGANFWKDIELPANVTLFESDGVVGFNMDAGLKMFGGWSKGYPQKSFAVFLRRKHGSGRLDYELFPGENVDGYESFTLRTSGNDNPGSHHVRTYFTDGSYTLFRDALMHRLLEGADLETQAYRPAIVYINGEYFGLYNLREKMSEHYIASHLEVNPDKLNIIQSHSGLVKGSLRDYNSMVNYIQKETRFSVNLKEKVYRQIQTLMDTDNFITHQVSVAYFQNFDIGNIKCWKEQTTGTRWRWMLFDQDYGFNLWNPDKYISAMHRDYSDYDNMFEFLTDHTKSREWPNGSKRTFLLRTLLRNEEFRTDFINRCADFLNSRFQSEMVLKKIDSIQIMIRPEMKENLDRWDGKMPDWEKHLNVMRDFARDRPQKLRLDLMDYFQLARQRTLTIQNNQPVRGKVRINSLMLGGFPWSGVYFDDVPVRLAAMPNRGYRFVGWSGDVSSTKVELQINPRQAQAVSVRFEPIELKSPKLVINEINYNSSSKQNPGDWLELHNPGTTAVTLDGWTLTDEADREHYVFSPRATIPPNGHVVVAREQSSFKQVFPGVTPLGPFQFGLGNGGDRLFLYDAAGALVDQVEYDDKSPWPSEPDGSGFTLERVDDIGHEGSHEDWAPSVRRLGTPGSANSAVLDQFRLVLAAPVLDAKGNLALKVTGAVAGGYAVESSANLLQWTPVEEAAVAGDQLLIPLNAKTNICRFFRLKKNP